MNKSVIVIKNDMFILNNKTIVEFEDGRERIVYNNIDPIVVLALAKRYSIKDIIVIGNQKFNLKYIERLENSRKRNYEDLEINIINGLKERK